MNINSIKQYKEEDLVLKGILEVLENKKDPIILLKNNIFELYKPIKQIPKFIEYISIEKQIYDPNIKYFNNSYFIKLKADFLNWILTEKESFKKELFEFINLIIARCNYNQQIIDTFIKNKIRFLEKIKLAYIDKLEIQKDVISFELQTRNYGVYKGQIITEYNSMSILEYYKNLNLNKLI